MLAALLRKKNRNYQSLTKDSDTFISQTMFYVAWALGACCAGAGFAMLVGFTPIFPTLFMITIFVLAVVLIIGLHVFKHEPFIAFPLLLLFGALIGFSMGPLLLVTLAVPGGALIIAEAVGITAVLTFALSAYAYFSKSNFSYLGGFLFMGLVGLIALSIVNMFVASPVLTVLGSAFGILLFSGYLLFDIGRIKSQANRSYDITPITAAVDIFLDVVNIFVNVLVLLLSAEANGDGFELKYDGTSAVTSQTNPKLADKVFDTVPTSGVSLDADPDTVDLSAVLANADAGLEAMAV